MTDLEKVKKNGYALQFIKEQTPEMCMAAVKQNGLALLYVREQTPEVCVAAVRQDSYAIQHVKDRKLKELLKQESNVRVKEG